MLMSLYGGKGGTLDTLRYRKFRDRVLKSVTSVQIQSMPPTSDAAKYHSFRVYYQVRQWMEMERDFDLKPEEWGWYYQHGKLLPVTMDSSPAPQSLLKVIRCQCKGDCDTKRCSCRNHGLGCSCVCSECRGTNCTNVSRLHVDHADEQDDLDLMV